MAEVVDLTLDSEDEQEVEQQRNRIMEFAKERAQKKARMDSTDHTAENLAPNAGAANPAEAPARPRGNSLLAELHAARLNRGQHTNTPATSSDNTNQPSSQQADKSTAQPGAGPAQITLLTYNVWYVHRLQPVSVLGQILQIMPSAFQPLPCTTYHAS